MDEINVLITATGGPTALGILKGLKDINGIRIIGTDIEKENAGAQFCDANYQIARISNTKRYVKDILTIINEENIHVIFPTMQDEITIYQNLKNEVNVKIAIPNSANTRALVDKEELYKYLDKKTAVKYIPEHYVFSTNQELNTIVQNKFYDDESVFVKGVSGHGGLGAVRLTSKEMFLDAIKKGKSKIYALEDYLRVESNERRMVMKYLDGMEYSVDVFAFKGEVITAIPRKRNRVSNGIVIDGSVDNNLEIIKSAKEVTERLLIDGFINMQFIESKDGYKLTDLNARFCGSQIMSFGANVNFPYLYISYNLLNKKIAVNPNWNTRMIRYWESCFFYD